MTLGQRIKELREEKEMTQEELGKLINVSKASFSKYESDMIEPSKDTIIFLAEYFNVSTDYLLGKSDIRNPESIFVTKEDLEFAAGVKSLSDTNRMIIKNTMEALIIKQEQDEENKDEKK